MNVESMYGAGLSRYTVATTMTCVGACRDARGRRRQTKHLVQRFDWAISITCFDCLHRRYEGTKSPD